uniref:DNA polymerase I (EC) n=1 Tax=uncultured Thiotrichaceae bacterium TaxID=298394 RepID=A0A6S6UA88_9GAMM|nr:MAG: DNA polymerase I (EC [uncultured Thiotrichaceae bacterium]
MSHQLLSRHPGERVWLVDSSIYVFRAWFVKGSMPYDKNHHPINAVQGFLRFLYAFLYEQQPQKLAFAFDISLQTSIRKELYPEYKANRDPAPAELKYQFQLCRDFIDALGIVQSASHHHEADDLIGTWAEQQRTADNQVIILSGDKDLAQLIKNDDLWWDYGRRKPLHDGGIKSEFGVWPQQLADQLAIAGDKADNIPGIPGVGMATAAKLLKRFGDIDNLLQNTDLISKMQVRGAKRLEGLVKEHQEIVLLSRKLTGIHCQVPDLPDNLSRGPKNEVKLRELCDLMALSEQQYQQWLHI